MDIVLQSSFIRRLRPESKGGSVRPYDVSASKGKERSLLPMSTMDAEQSKQTVLSPSQIAHNASVRVYFRTFLLKFVSQLTFPILSLSSMFVWLLAWCAELVG